MGCNWTTIGTHSASAMFLWVQMLIVVGDLKGRRNEIGNEGGERDHFIRQR